MMYLTRFQVNVNIYTYKAYCNYAICMASTFTFHYILVQKHVHKYEQLQKCPHVTQRPLNRRSWIITFVRLHTTVFYLTSLIVNQLMKELFRHDRHITTLYLVQYYLTASLEGDFYIHGMSNIYQLPFVGTYCY